MEFIAYYIFKFVLKWFRLETEVDLMCLYHLPFNTAAIRKGFYSYFEPRFKVDTRQADA